MLIRTVRMTFRPEKLEVFIRLFSEVAPTIRSFPGCRRLELWQDVQCPHILTTYSVWEDEEHLDRYRQSDFFRETWNAAKDFFSGPASAASQRIIHVDQVTTR
jgi:quinol monooxygenase YgiN